MQRNAPSHRPEDQSGAAAAVIIGEQGYAEDNRAIHRIQSSFVVRRLAARFGLRVTTAATVAELAGFPAGGRA